MRGVLDRMARAVEALVPGARVQVAPGHLAQVAIGRTHRDRRCEQLGLCPGNPMRFAGVAQSPAMLR